VLDFYAVADVVSPSRVSDYIHDALDGLVLREAREAQTLGQLIERLLAEPDLRRKVGDAASKTMLERDCNRNAAALSELP
jgi:hypothetical protein